MGVLKNKITMNDVGLALIRLLTGIVFVFHGSQKLFGSFGGSGIEGFSGFLASMHVPYPVLNAYVAGGAEFFGGLALLCGVGLRLAALPLMITMIVAAFTAHSGFDIQRGGMEYPLMLAFVVAGLGFTGAGKLTLYSLVRVQGRFRLFRVSHNKTHAA